MPELSEAQRRFAGQHVGEQYSTTDIQRGVCVAWFDGGGDTALLLCSGPDGPFMVRQVLPVDEDEAARRTFVTEQQADEQRAADAERLAAAQQEATEAFGVQLARFLGIDPADEAAIGRVRAAMHAAAVAAPAHP